MDPMHLNEVIRETCSCGEVEHNPNTCPACQEEGDWAHTFSTMEWFEAHAALKTEFHIRNGKVFTGKHEE
jgi:hypothetical protein